MISKLDEIMPCAGLKTASARDKMKQKIIICIDAINGSSLLFEAYRIDIPIPNVPRNAIVYAYISMFCDSLKCVCYKVIESDLHKS